MAQSEINRFFNAIENRKVLVIGDVMIDAYLWGRVERVSPEAPVPVVDVMKRTNSLGGAANVALNIRALGAVPILCSVVGHDLKGKEFIDLMKAEGLITEGIVHSKGRLTTTKFRVFGNRHQMLRVDEETRDDLSQDDESALRTVIQSIMEDQQIEAVILQDYNKGVLTQHLINAVTEMASQKGIPVAVDPKKKNFRSFRDVTLFKPNLKEIREGLQMDIRLENPWELENAANIIHREQKVRMVFTTLSEHGVFISFINDENQIERKTLAAHRRKIADVSGAGDTVISVAALCLVAGLGPEEIAAFSNLAGGLVCEEVGVVPIDAGKFRSELLGL